MKKIAYISEKQIRVLYEIQCYNLYGIVVARCYENTKRRAEKVVNTWRKKTGQDADLRKLRRSEWFLINPADIESEVK